MVFCTPGSYSERFHCVPPNGVHAENKSRFAMEASNRGRILCFSYYYCKLPNSRMAGVFKPYHALWSGLIPSFKIDMSMYKEIRSNVIDKLISYAGAKHGIAFLEGGHQTTRYEAGECSLFGMTCRYGYPLPSGFQVPLPLRREGARLLCRHRDRHQEVRPLHSSVRLASLNSRVVCPLTSPCGWAPSTLPATTRTCTRWTRCCSRTTSPATSRSSLLRWCT